MTPLSQNPEIEKAVVMSESLPIGQSGLYKVVIEVKEQKGSKLYDVLAVEPLEVGDVKKVVQIYYQGHLVNFIVKEGTK